MASLHEHASWQEVQAYPGNDAVQNGGTGRPRKEWVRLLLGKNFGSAVARGGSNGLQEELGL